MTRQGDTVCLRPGTDGVAICRVGKAAPARAAAARAHHNRRCDHRACAVGSAPPVP